MFQPKIAIVGCGPAGLTLGLLLVRQNLPFTIFELRQEPAPVEFSEPCGVLDLHDESGQAALRECGLYDDFLQLTGECAEAQRVSNMHGEIVYADEGELSDRPEISRHALTKMLLEAIPSHTIKWGHKLLSATRSSDKTMLDFGPNGTHEFDLVVGADGAWSKMRELVTQTKLKYAGVHNITLTIRGVTTRYPELAQFVGPGSFSALGLNRGVMSQRGPQDSARIYCFVTSEESVTRSSGLAMLSASEAKHVLLNNDALFGNWGPKIHNLVSTACNEEDSNNPEKPLDIKALYDLPVGHSWVNQPGVTLIGDAAHLMCPWAGEGVNLAMWDALDLSHAIVKDYMAATTNRVFGGAANSAIKDFETKMAGRAAEKAQETKSNGEMLFGKDAANTFVKFFESAYGPPPDKKSAFAD